MSRDDGNANVKNNTSLDFVLMLDQARIKLLSLSNFLSSFAADQKMRTATTMFPPHKKYMRCEKCLIPGKKRTMQMYMSSALEGRHTILMAWEEQVR